MALVLGVHLLGGLRKGGRPRLSISLPTEPQGPSPRRRPLA